MKGRCTSNYLLHTFEKSDKEFSHQNQWFLCFSKFWPPPSEQKFQSGDWAWLGVACATQPLLSPHLLSLQPALATGLGNRRVLCCLELSCWHRSFCRDHLHLSKARRRIDHSKNSQPSSGLALEQPSQTSLPSAKLWRGCHLHQTPPLQLPFLQMIKTGSTPLALSHWYAVCRDFVNILYLPIPASLYKQETAF